MIQNFSVTGLSVLSYHHYNIMVIVFTAYWFQNEKDLGNLHAGNMREDAFKGWVILEESD